jgi:cytochrome c556
MRCRSAGFAILLGLGASRAPAAAPPLRLAAAHRVFRPVAPEVEYYKLKHLMADGMMPNYKALWSAFRRDDAAAMRAALGYMAALARDTIRYPVPDAARGAALDDFRARMADLADRSDALAARMPAGRDAMSSGILSIYGKCQECHDRYAPEEGRDRRKYSPPAD